MPLPPPFAPRALFARLFRSAALRTAAGTAALALGALSAAGCNPSIGDKCTLSTDCSLRGDRQCDVAQPDGYCTILNCGANSCPSGEAACVLFRAAIPGCAYDDRSVSRTARSFCMKICTTNSDCRDGYECLQPGIEPWSALILDDDQTPKVCIARPRETSETLNVSAPPDAGVCQRSGPELDGGEFPLVDSGAVLAPDAAPDAGGSADAGFDATVHVDGGDAGVVDGGSTDAAHAAD